MTTSVLSTVEFEAYWDRLGHGELPPVLDIPSAGRTTEERGRLVDGVREGLRARGIGDRLAEDLAVLSRFAWAVDARVVTSTPIHARGAVAAEWGVLAVRRGDEVTVERMAEHRLITELVALAGQAPATRVESVSVRADALDTASARAGGDLHALAQNLITLGERAAAARAVARLCHGAHTRGQFAARPGGAVIGFHDTPTGRYLHLRRDGWVTFTTIGGTGLVPHVRELTPRNSRG